MRRHGDAVENGACWHKNQGRNQVCEFNVDITLDDCCRNAGLKADKSGNFVGSEEEARSALKLMSQDLPVPEELKNRQVSLSTRGRDVVARMKGSNCDRKAQRIDDWVFNRGWWDFVLENVQAEPSLDEADESRTSQFDILLKIGIACKLLRTPDGEAFARIENDSPREVWGVTSKSFEEFLRFGYFDETGRAPSKESLTNAIATIETLAKRAGHECEIPIRIAMHKGNIYVDLCNDRWQVVEVSPDGWSVLNDSPVYFTRRNGMLPLPVPVEGGTISELREFANVDDTDWALILAWLLVAFNPSCPYPILYLTGEQGSGKSTFARLLRSLVDPNVAALRSEPKDEKDLMIAARNSWCLAFDNLSKMSQWLSDALCRLATGGGSATRELYTNFEEVIIDARRPMMLTAITDIISKPDLLDRMLIVRLKAMRDNQRCTESDLLKRFDESRPRILGALLEAVCVALRNFATVKLSEYPRMADFAKWGVAGEPALDLSKGEFLRSYQQSQQAATGAALEASLIVKPLLTYVDENGGFEGTATDLLSLLDLGGGDLRFRDGWPKTAQTLSGQLGRIAPNLRATGIDIRQVQTSGSQSSKVWKIHRRSENGGIASRASQSSLLSREREKE